jgi:hypothetical protein
VALIIFLENARLRNGRELQQLSSYTEGIRTEEQTNKEQTNKEQTLTDIDNRREMFNWKMFNIQCSKINFQLKTNQTKLIEEEITDELIT